MEIVLQPQTLLAVVAGSMLAGYALPSVLRGCSTAMRLLTQLMLLLMVSLACAGLWRAQGGTLDPEDWMQQARFMWNNWTWTTETVSWLRGRDL